MAINEVLAQAKPKMDKAVEHLLDELKGLRTGRASTALVEGLSVEQYGQTMNLKQVATLSVPDPRTIQISPWDPTMLPVIEKAIREAQSLGLNPNNDGHAIRINLPPLNEETRKNLVKALGEKLEQCHIALRNIRHELLDQVKKLERDKQATQDDVRHAETELNKRIEEYREQIKGIEDAKTKEIMEV